MRERGLKRYFVSTILARQYVAPCAGAWVETADADPEILSRKSLPVRERGLKPLDL